MTNSTCEEAYSYCLQVYESYATNQNITIGEEHAGNVFQNNGSGGVNINSKFQANNYVGYNSFTNNCLNSYSLAASPTPDSAANVDLQYCGMFKSFSENVNSNGLSVSSGGQGTIIENNVLTSSAPSNLANGWSGSAAGIWPDTVIGHTVRFNTISGMFSSGVHLEKTGASNVYGNTIFNNDTEPYPYRQTEAGIDVICSQHNNSQHNQIFNNSIYGSNWGISAHPDTQCNFSYNTFTNNIMTGATGGTELYNTKPADNSDYGEGGTGNTYTYNNFGPQPTDEGCFFVYGSTCYASYDAFDTAVGSTTNSVEGDPMFVCPPNGNLNLLIGSPAIEAGTAISGFYPAGLNLGVQYPTPSATCGPPRSHSR